MNVDLAERFRFADFTEDRYRGMLETANRAHVLLVSACSTSLVD
jgi:hypothetical protein